MALPDCLLCVVQQNGSFAFGLLKRPAWTIIVISELIVCYHMGSLETSWFMYHTFVDKSDLDYLTYTSNTAHC
jgi:hypothetical protein